MWPVFPGAQTTLVVLAIVVVVLLSIRVVQPEWWQSRIVRVAILIASCAMLVGGTMWSAGHATESVRAVYIGAGITYCTVLVVLPAALVMPLAAGIDRTLMAISMRSTDRRAQREPAEGTSLSSMRSRVSRRALIRLGSASLPAIAAVGGAKGLIDARRPPTMPVIRLRYPNLHPDLEGLKILQLSDLHLGACLGLEDLERGLAIARAAHRPDLIVVTGDVADDPALLPAALRLIAESNARHGAFASLGNHEYLHDIDVTRPLFEASPIPLFVSDGRAIRVGRATLFIGGADDPVHMSGDIAGLLEPSIALAASRAPAHADFRLLLCHRPEGFEPATRCGFDLTLSGHTHGGQIGLFGRSLFEKIKPGIGWWGAYSKRRPPGLRASPSGPSRLYTTSGFGHWFPFRAGCPTEMPLLVLEGGAWADSGARRV